MGYPFARNVKALRENVGMSQTEFAEAIGVTKQTVLKWEQGGVSKPRQDSVMEQLCSAFGVSPRDMLGEIDGFYAKRHGLFRAPAGAIAVERSSAGSVPVAALGAVHAGESDMPWSFDGGNAMLLSELHDRHPNCYALEVNGGCMNRVFTEADHIFVDPDMTPRDGSIAVALIDGEAVVRRVKAGSSSYMLVAESYEAGYGDIIVAGDDAKWLGVVFWWQAKSEVR